jgi:hypothetical protein
VIAALLPMAFVSGLMGPYMSPIPINASLGMAISLAIAFTVTPWLALKLMKSHGHGHAAPAVRRSRAGKGLAPNCSLFTRVLTPVPRTAARRWLLLAGILAALVLSVGLTLVQLGGAEDAALRQQERVPGGARHAGRHAAGRTPRPRCTRWAASWPAARGAPTYQGYAGTASPITFNGLVRQYYLRADAEQGDLQVNLVDKHRNEKSHAAQRLRPALEQSHGARQGGRMPRPPRDEPAGG